MKIPKGIYQDNFSFLNCSIWLKNGRLVKKTVLDSQKGEKRHFDHNFFKIGHSELFIGLFCLLLTHWWYKIVIWQIPDAIRKSVWVDMELPKCKSRKKLELRSAKRNFDAAKTLHRGLLYLCPRNAVASYDKAIFAIFQQFIACFL